MSIKEGQLKLIDIILSLSNKKVFLLGLVLAGGYYLTLFDNGSKLQSKNNQMIKVLKAQKKELEKFDKILEEKEKYGDILPELKKEIKRVIQYLPNNLRANDLIKIISSQSKNSGTTLTSIQNAKTYVDPKKPNVEEISIELSLSGTYSQILTFLSYLTKQKVIATTKKLSLRFDKEIKESKNPILNMTGVIAVYRYIEKVETKGTQG